MEDSITDITRHAFNIISFDTQKFNNALLDSDEVINISSKIFHPGVSCLQISKFACVVQILFKSNPKKAIEKCPFIMKFINFAQYSAIISMFSELLKAKDEEVQLFVVLINWKHPFVFRFFH